MCAIEVVCDLLLNSGMVGQVPKSPDVKGFMTEKEALFVEWEHVDS